MSWLSQLGRNYRLHAYVTNLIPHNEHQPVKQLTIAALLFLALGCLIFQDEVRVFLALGIYP